MADTVKDTVQQMLGAAEMGIRLSQKELYERFAYDAHLQLETSDAIELRSAYEDMMDGLATFKAYADKM